jgi:hypothetical protein
LLSNPVEAVPGRLERVGMGMGMSWKLGKGEEVVFYVFSRIDESSIACTVVSCFQYRLLSSSHLLSCHVLPFFSL